MFDNIVKIGMIVQKTLSEIELLERDVAEWVMIHNLHEHSPVSSSAEDSKDQVKILLKLIEPRIKQVNHQIKGLNKIATYFQLKSHVKILEKDALFRLIRQRFGVLADDKNVELTNENFELKKYNLLLRTRQSIFEYVEAMDHHKEYDEFRKVERKYARQLKSAADIMSIRIYDVAVFTAGRAVEECVNNYIHFLIKAKKMKHIKVAEHKFENKIGMLWKNGQVSEKLFHDLQSVRISRNDTGHPKSVAYAKDEVRHAIGSAYTIIQNLEKKMPIASKQPQAKT